VNVWSNAVAGISVFVAFHEFLGDHAFAENQKNPDRGYLPENVFSRLRRRRHNDL
jgi:hypothetical protein